MDDLDTRLGRDGVATEFATFIVVISAVEFVGGRAVAFRYLDGRDLEVVLSLAGGVRAEK